MPPIPFALTPNYNFNLPSVGGDPNVWGGMLNNNWASADTLFKSLDTAVKAVTDVSIGQTAPAVKKPGDFWLDNSVVTTPRLRIWTGVVWALAAPVQTPPVEVSATAPTSPVEGDLWYDTTAPAGLFMRTGGAWLRLTGAPPVQEVPVGAFMWHTGRTVPDGYLLANGAAILSTSPAQAALRALYIADGSPYGTSSGNPLLPNLTTAERFVRASLGAGVGAVQTDAFQDHGHRITRQNGGGSGGNGEWIGTNDTPGNTTRDNRVTVPVAGTQGAPRTAAETRPVNIALLPCVKL